MIPDFAAGRTAQNTLRSWVCTLEKATLQLDEIDAQRAPRPDAAH